MSNSLTTTNHPAPGQVIRDEFLEPLGITPYRFAKDIKVHQSSITRLLRNETHITPQMALRLESYFGPDAEFWINLQSNYDIAVARTTTDLPDIPRAH